MGYLGEFAVKGMRGEPPFKAKIWPNEAILLAAISDGKAFCVEMGMLTGNWCG